MPALTTSSIGSWNDFERVLQSRSDYASVPYANYAFRGHSRECNNLLPALARILKGSNLDTSQQVTLETTLAREFAARAENVGVICDPAANLATAALMRHYGAPTRLLDWTFSAVVALYFAVESHFDGDGELWSVPTFAANRVLGSNADWTGHDDRIEKYFDTLAPAGETQFVRIAKHNPRSAAQHGLFSVADSPTSDHLPLLVSATEAFLSKKTPEWSVHSPERFVVKREAKHELLRALWTRNIHAASLFPDVDGLGRYARDLATWRTELHDRSGGRVLETASDDG
jgi:FRG domain-containing protein